MNEIQKATQSLRSQGTSQNTPSVPDQETAAVISMLIDKSRAAMGWNRLPEREQDIAIVTWFEILSDAGVRPERYADCYRAAQQRESERRRLGHERQIVTPNDLAVEWEKVRRMHDDLDRTRLLPENAAAACQRCFGTNKEEMPDGTVKDDCSHLPLTDEEKRERAQAKAKTIEFMREAMRQINKPKPRVEVKSKFFHLRMECDYCHRRVDNPLGEAWQDGDTCGAVIGESETKEPIICEGKLYAFKRIESPV